MFNRILLLWNIDEYNEQKEFYDQNLGWVGKARGLTREETHK